MKDGIINVIKPPGMTSYQVVSFLRRTLRVKKVGHGGTLDPGAAGVLPVCIGKGTRVVPFLIDKDKTYVAEMTLGISTDTQDASGKTLQMDTNVRVTPNQLGEAMASFLGTIEQIPPMASAIRVEGQRLYKLARQGKEVERKPRKAVIKELHVNKVWPEEPELRFGSRVLFSVTCSKGTYIRTLCSDLGRKLGTAAHLSFLSRTQSGPFKIEEGITLEEIVTAVKQNDYSFVLPIEAALPDWPRVVVSPLAEGRICHGNAVATTDLINVPTSLVVGDQVLIFSVDQTLLALGEIAYRDKLICRPTRVLREGS